jgi:hypothetical protein
MANKNKGKILVIHDGRVDSDYTAEENIIFKAPEDVTERDLIITILNHNCTDFQPSDVEIEGQQLNIYYEDYPYEQ